MRLRPPAADLLYAEFEIMLLQLAQEAAADGESDAAATARALGARGVGRGLGMRGGRPAVIAIQFWF